MPKNGVQAGPTYDDNGETVFLNSPEEPDEPDESQDQAAEPTGRRARRKPAGDSKSGGK